MSAARFDRVYEVSEAGELPERARIEMRAKIRSMRGQKIRVRLGEPERSSVANAYYWGVVIAAIWKGWIDAGIANVAAGGRPYTAEEIHEIYKHLYCPETAENVVVSPHGEPTGKTTARLSRKEFAEYVDRVIADQFVSGAGIWIPDAATYEQEAGKRLGGFDLTSGS